jgi:uncharacterized membrane protein
MRLGLVIVGVILLVIGAVLLFVPVVPQANETVSTSSTLPYDIFSVGGFSLTGSIPISVSWTSSSGAVEVVAAACSSCSSQNASSVSGVTIQNGTSGSFSLSQPDGGEVLVGAIGSMSSPTNVTFKITTALTTVGSILVIVGIVVLILGAVLKSGKAKAAAAAAPMSPMMPSPPMIQPPAPTPGAPPAQPPMGSS